MIAPGRSHQDGFTLIEAVIAVAILGTVVVVLVTALAGLLSASQFHRGNAVAETATRNFTQALEARVAARGTLTSAMIGSSTTVSVRDVALFASSGFIAVDMEIMRITSRNLAANSLTVARSASRAYASWPAGDTSSVTTHGTGAPVAAAYMCPSAVELTPDATQYTSPVGVTSSISGVEYWDPKTGAFQTDQQACVDAYKARCLYNDGTPDLRPDCDVGLERVTIATSTGGDPRLKGVPALTQVLVRRGSA